jgi:hypothetical protein
MKDMLYFFILVFTLAFIISSVNASPTYSMTYLYFRSKCSDITNQIQCESSGCNWWCRFHRKPLV